ncbi:hypothetical protein RQP46_005353 [Phenoliferia psychrophenolica]
MSPSSSSTTSSRPSSSILGSIRGPFRTLQPRASTSSSSNRPRSATTDLASLGDGWAFNRTLSTSSSLVPPPRTSSLAHLSHSSLGNGVGIPNGRLLSRGHRNNNNPLSTRPTTTSSLELDAGFQHSIQRASDALNASRQNRVAAELRGRTRSAHFVEQEVRGHERGGTERESYERYLEQGPTRQLRKARSVDLLSPRHEHHHQHHAQHARTPTENNVQSLHSLLPAYLPVPTEPPSKFSASTGNSRLDDDDDFKDDPDSSRDSSNNHAGRARAKTLSHMHSLRELLRKTPSKLSLRKKPSLASLFTSAAPPPSSASSSSQSTSQQHPAPKKKPSHLSRIPTRATTASSTPSPVSESSSKRSFIRTALHRHVLSDSTTSNSSSYDPRSSSEGGRSFEDTSSGGGRGARRWVGKLGRAVTGGRKQAQVQPSPVIVRLAEKVPAANMSQRVPSRIPIATVFADSTNHIRQQPQQAPRPRPRAVYSPTAADLSPPPPPAHAALGGDELNLPSRARPVHRKAVPPVARTRPLSLVGVVPQPLFPSKRASIPAPPATTLLPAAELRPRPLPPLSLILRPTSLTPTTASDSSSSSEDTSRTPPSPSPLSNDHRRSFRSPSPARFRDLLPSPCASSSPDKTPAGLPAPSVSPKSVVARVSPKKLAMGPEQIIEMEASHLGPDTGVFQQVCGATSDLADLLSALDDHSTSYDPALITSGQQDLSRSLRQYLPVVPRVESVESLRSTVSDVPDDLRLLIQSVEDQIDEVEFLGPPLDPEDEEEEEEERYFGEDEVLQELERTEMEDDEEEDETSGSFEGHVSTAAMALRSMLDGPGPGEKEPRYTRPLSVVSRQVVQEEEDDEDERPSRFRDSVQEYLAMERPTVGDKMMDNMDISVSLASLVAAHSPPPSPIQARPPPPQRHPSDSSTGTCSIMGSPTPANGPRRAIARYSADPRSAPAPPPPVESRPSDRPPSYESDHSNSRSSEEVERDEDHTNFSISSVNSSPCAGPKRRVPMLTRNNPMPTAGFRFPPAKPRAGWEKKDEQQQQPKKESTSPFKKVFSPLEQFRNKTQRRIDDDEAEVEQAASPSSSPRFVRPLQPPRLGVAIARPRPLSSEAEGLIPPDTPPPSSPSHSDRSSMSSLSSFRHVQVDPTPAPPVPHRASKGHSRQISRASSLLQDTILEESPEKPGPMTELAPPLKLAPPLETILEPLSPGVPFDVVADEDEEDEDDQEEFPLRADMPRAFNLTFTSGPTEEKVDPYDLRDEADVYSGGLGIEDEDTSRVLRSFVHYAYEAEVEVKRSQARWPDTEASLEAMAYFDIPKNWHEMLQFLFDSQNRFVSIVPVAPPSTTRAFYLSPDDSQHSISRFASQEFLPLDFPSSPPTPDLSPNLTPSPDDESIPSPPSPPSPTPAPVPVPKRRLPLGAKPLNRQLVLAQSTSSPSKAPSDALSPFTALPPKLTGKLRGLRAKLSPSPKKKTVDTAFLGEGVEAKMMRRRKTEWDASLRKLEGVGHAREQRSDDESDQTGVVEAAGEGAFRSFIKTPKLSTSRPRVRRKPALTHLR